MIEELRTLALYLKELQLREKFGGILDEKKVKKYNSRQENRIF